MSDSRNGLGKEGGALASDCTLTLAELQVGDGLGRLLASNSALNIVRVDHGEAESGHASLLDLAMKDADARRVLVELANNAFVAYACKQGVTSFVRHRFIGKLWERVRSGQFQIDGNGLVHVVERPLYGFSGTRLVVVFSSLAETMRMPYLMRHFGQDFPDVQKRLPAGAAILRIADMGGVLGAFYLNTHGLPDNERHVQELIGSVTGKLGMTRDDVVLYGKGKGGTAALYHGLAGNYRVVASDPIVSDEYHVKSRGDPHFTVGTFPESKQDKFIRMCGEANVELLRPMAIICSDRLPQFSCLRTVLLEPVLSRIACFNSRRADIKTPPDVPAKTQWLAEMLLNMQLYRLPIPTGMHDVDEVGHRGDPGSLAP